LVAAHEDSEWQMGLQAAKSPAIISDMK